MNKGESEVLVICKESALSKHWNRNQHCGFKSAEVEMMADRKCAEDVKHERRQALIRLNERKKPFILHNIGERTRTLKCPLIP